MDAHAENLLQSALSLPANDRAEIAASLIESLDEETEADVEAAWVDEVKRRLESIDKGEVQLIPAEEVMRSMRERLNG
jgi:putative addiction module component (TIGR02574 family)